MWLVALCAAPRCTLRGWLMRPAVSRPRRAGDFPNGIAILTVADYFSLAVRQGAYLQVAPILAAYPEYTSAFCDTLLQAKLLHWDAQLRHLAAQVRAPPHPRGLMQSRG